MGQKKIGTYKEFQELVLEMIKQEIREQMVSEMTSTSTSSTYSTSSSLTGTKPSLNGNKQNPNKAGAENIMVPNTTMNLNQFLTATSKEKNFDKQKKMIAQASDLAMQLKEEKDEDESREVSSKEFREFLKQQKEAFARAIGKGNKEK